MLGRRKLQQDFFSAQNVPHRVPADSFYGRMGAVSAELYCDDDLKGMYHPDKGRPSLPPSLMSCVQLLQFYADVSDEEAVQRCQFDLRWQVALNLPTDFAGFDPSSLTYFRRRLVEHHQERYAFDRLVQVGRTAGFIADRVTLLTDTTRTTGAGAVQDTYTLLRKGIRKLLKQSGYAVPGKAKGLAPETERLVATYLQQDRKAQIDWSDPAQRAEQLKVLYQDAETALDLALEHMDDADVRATGWILIKIMGDDIAIDEQGQPQLGQGTAPERIISITDPEMRHGRKSAAQRFAGYKVAVTTDQDSELLVDIQDLPASGGDGQALIPTIERVEAHAGVTVEAVVADGAYGSGPNRAACAERTAGPVDLLSPLYQPADPAVHKSAFDIDLDAATATCPQGHTVSAHPGDTEDGRPTLEFAFPRSVCETCPLFARCVKSRVAGRTVTTSAYERYLQAARQRQQSEAFKQAYRRRCAIERKQAELVGHGLRNTRYIGAAKRQLQRLWTGAVVNLKRLFRLCDKHSKDLRTLLQTMKPAQTAFSVA